MSFQVHYYLNGSRVSARIPAATISEARRLASPREPGFAFDMAVIETVEAHDTHRTVAVMRRAAERAA